MNNGTHESAAATHAIHATTSADELDALKRELMKAEVRLAKARATVTGAEIDIKVLSARLKSLAK